MNMNGESVTSKKAYRKLAMQDVSGLNGQWLSKSLVMHFFSSVRNI